MPLRTVEEEGAADLNLKELVSIFRWKKWGGRQVGLGVIPAWDQLSPGRQLPPCSSGHYQSCSALAVPWSTVVAW